MKKHFIFLLGLLLSTGFSFAETSMSISDPGNTAVIDITGFSLEGTTGEITVLLPDDEHTSIFTTTNYGDTVFLDLKTYAVRVCTMDSISIDSEGRVSYKSKPGVPCLATSASEVNICGANNVLLMDLHVRGGEEYVCEGYHSIAALNYRADNNSITTLIAPVVSLSPGFIVSEGAVFSVLPASPQ